MIISDESYSSPPSGDYEVAGLSEATFNDALTSSGSLSSFTVNETSAYDRDSPKLGDYLNYGEELSDLSDYQESFSVDALEEDVLDQKLSKVCIVLVGHL